MAEPRQESAVLGLSICMECRASVCARECAMCDVCVCEWLAKVVHKVLAAANRECVRNGERLGGGEKLRKGLC